MPEGNTAPQGLSRFCDVYFVSLGIVGEGIVEVAGIWIMEVLII